MWIVIFPKKYTNGQETQKKILTISSHLAEYKSKL
jgi:hypothetical protein